VGSHQQENAACGPTIFSGTLVVSAPNNEPELPLREALIALFTLIVFLACLMLAAMPWA
jgi:hypothetical protein